MNIEIIMTFLAPLLMGLFMILIFRSFIKKFTAVFFHSKNAQSEMQTQDNDSNPAKKIMNYSTIIIALIFFVVIYAELETVLLNEGSPIPSNIDNVVGSLFAMTIFIVIAKASHSLFKSSIKGFHGLLNSPILQNLKNSKDLTDIKNIATTNLTSALPLSLIIQSPQALKPLVSANASNKTYIYAELDKITKINNLKELSDQEYDFMGTHQDGTDHRYRMKMNDKNKNEIIKMTRYS